MFNIFIRNSVMYTNSPQSSPKKMSPKNTLTIDQPSNPLGQEASSAKVISSQTIHPILKRSSKPSLTNSAEETKVVGGKQENISITTAFVTKRNCKKNELKFYTEESRVFQGVTAEIKSIDHEKNTLVLHNIARNMQLPIFLDIKIGEKFSDNFYLQNQKGLTGDKLIKKIADREDENKQTGASQHSFWIAGYSKQRHQDKYKNREDINNEGLPHFIYKHFNHNTVLAEKIAQRIDQLLLILNENKCALEDGGNNFAFISSSLLIAYDESDPMNMDMKIIDFDQFWKIDEEDSYDPDKQNSIDKFNSAFHKGLNSFKHLMLNMSGAL